MKYRGLIHKIFFLCSLFLFQCLNNDGVANTIMANHNGNLIPFVEFDSADEEKWGYLDEDTGEIAIKAKYNYAYPFVGGFAIVSGNGYRSEIINLIGKTVNTGKFDEAYLFTSENGKNTLAVLGKRYTRTKFDIGFRFWGPNDSPHFYQEDYSKYLLVNLVTGKTIIPLKENYLNQSIEVVGGFFIVKPDLSKIDLYKFLDNGDVECVAENIPQLAADILKKHLEERGINVDINADSYYVKIDYSPYIKRIFATPPDLSGALRNLPHELTFIKAEPFYRNHRKLLNAPFEITEKKYRLYFNVEGSDFRAQGIYNESEAEWEITPFFDFNAINRNVLYYTKEIRQTNNPSLYYVTFTNEEIGWDMEARMGGGLYSLIENDYMINGFMGNLYLLEDYPQSDRYILMLGASGEPFIKFPDKGVYYRDYGRIKNKF